MRLQNRHGHLLSWMSTGKNNGLRINVQNIHLLLWVLIVFAFVLLGFDVMSGNGQRCPWSPGSASTCVRFTHNRRTRYAAVHSSHFLSKLLGSDRLVPVARLAIRVSTKHARCHSSRSLARTLAQRQRDGDGGGGMHGVYNTIWVYHACFTFFAGSVYVFCWEQGLAGRYPPSLLRLCWKCFRCRSALDRVHDNS